MLKFEGTDKIRDIKYEDGYVDKIYYDNNTQLVFTSDKEKTGTDEVQFKGRKLIDVTSYGKCEQNGTPTPDNPVDIVCNNGVLKFSLNEFDPNAVEPGYYRNANTGAQTESHYNFLTAMMPVKPSTSYVLFGRRKSDNRLSAYNRIYWFDSNQNFISTSSYSVNTVTVATSPANAAYAQGGINESGGTSIPTTQEIIDDYNWVFQQGTAEMSYTPYSPTGIYTDGTVETITITPGGGTATAEMLLKVGDYQDVQSILDGAVTRNVGVKVLDGTEPLAASDVMNMYSLGVPNLVGTIETNRLVYCTHFKNSSTLPTTAYRQGYCIKGHSSGRSYISFGATTQFPNFEQFQQYLADQYAAGTPVIVIYPLATPTTEQVQGQQLAIQQGNNTIEITQASIDDIQLKVKYK